MSNLGDWTQADLERFILNRPTGGVMESRPSSAKFTPATLQNGWVPWGAPYGVPRYLRRDGFVYLRGMMKSGTVGAAAFVLPPGYLPTEQILLDAISNDAIGRVEITVAGAVVPVTPSVSNWVALDGLSFPIF